MSKLVDVDAPILVLDSGLGGISILNALQTKLPNENFIYFADYAFLPYGEKSEIEIKTRCKKIVEAFSSQTQQSIPKAVVLACNTATASAISFLRASFDIEFFGTEPGIKPAAKESKLGIAVLATTLTLQSEQFAKLIKQYANNSPVFSLPAPELVMLVESGEWQDEKSAKLIDTIFKDIDGKFDTLLLGCTHFSFLTKQLNNKFGKQVKIIDTSDAIATRVFNRLNENKLLSTNANKPTHLAIYYSSTSDNKFNMDKKIELLTSSLSPAFHVAKIVSYI